MTQESGKVEKSETENPANMGRVGYKHPPVNRQFGQPNGNKPGKPYGWRKSDTPRYKMERLLKMTREELIKVVKDDGGEIGFFEQAIAKNILELGGNSSPQNMSAMNSLVNQVYGMPKEQKDITSNGQQITGLEIGFKDYTEKKEKADEQDS